MKSFFKTLVASTLGVFIAFLIFTLFVVAFFVSVIATMSQPKETKIEDKTVLHLSLSNIIGERGSNDPFANIDFNTFEKRKSLGLDQALEAIHKASADPKVSGLYLKMSLNNEMGFASMQELRDALVSFKDSGKFIVSYGEMIGEGAYFLASVSDQIYLNHAGDMLFNGLSSQVWFFKKALDKAGVEMQVFKYGKFKSAVEPYLLEELSPENREQITRYAQSLEENYLKQIAMSRKMNVNQIKLISDSMLVRSANDAVKLKMIDGLKSESETKEWINKKLKLKKSEDYNALSLVDYHSALQATPADKKDKKKAKIAVLYAVGAIGGDDGSSGEITSESMLKAIKEIKKDKEVKAVVLRINSPGGSAMVSDIIYRELVELKKSMPIIVSMGDVAASGGYYIACMADTIVAQPNTITGSIGVFGLFPNMKKLLNEHIGITVDEVNTGKYSDFGRVDRAVTTEEREIIQRMINRIYEDFVNLVAKGRNMSFDQVNQVAEGRVWTGSDAKTIGLVDVLGGIETAKNIAAQKANLNSYEVKCFPEQKSPLESFFKSAKTDLEETALKARLGQAYPILKQYQQLQNARGIQMRMPFDIQVQ